MFKNQIVVLKGINVKTNSASRLEKKVNHSLSALVIFSIFRFYALIKNYWNIFIFLITSAKKLTKQD